MASLIPGARFVPLPGENHILLEEDAGWPDFLRILRRFLPSRDCSDQEPRPGQIGDRLERLTPREREVLDLLGDGLKNTEIAERLFIAPKTVRNHVSHIYAKLDVDTRARAVIVAREARSR
jgi:DNA-binding NarL/FixJ family response regulator